MSWCRSSTGRRSSTPGNCAGVIPGIFDDPYVGKHARELLRRRAALLDEDRGQKTAARARRVRFLSRQPRRRRHRTLRPTRTRDVCHPPRPPSAPATGQAGRAVQPLPGGLHRAEGLGPGGLSRGVRRDDRPRHGRTRGAVPGRARRLQQDHDAGALRPVGGGVRGVPPPPGAPAIGATARRRPT